MNSRWVLQLKTPGSKKQAIRGILKQCQAVLQVARQHLLQQEKFHFHLVQIQADRSVSRQHFTGTVGLKPTYGRVSRFGLVAFASSLDQIGPITRNVEDNAYLLQAIAGVDANDSTSANVEVPDYAAALTGDIKGLKIAVPKEYLGEGVGEEARQSVHGCIEAA